MNAKPARRPALPWSLRLIRLTVRIADRLWPALAARIADSIWRHAPRYAPPAHETRWLAQAQHQTLTFNGRALAVEIWGEGPTVLLVHGWSGRGTQLGAFVAPLTAAGFRVVAFDAPAHGRSPGRSTSALEIAAALQTVADTYGPVHAIIAHSFGTLATLLALRDGLRVGRVVCLSAPAGVSALFARYTERLGLSPHTVQLLRARNERRYGADVWQRADATRLAARAQVPVLVIHDRDDRDVPWEEGAAIAQVWPHAEWLLTDGLGHRRILRDETVIARAVGFIKTAC